MLNNYSLKHSLRGYSFGVFMFYASALVVALITMAFKATGATQFFIATIISQLSFFAAVYFFSKSARVNFVTATKSLNKPKSLSVILAVILGLTTLCFMLPIQHWYFEFIIKLGHTPIEAFIPMMDNFVYAALLIITVAFIPSICEELLFRGLIFNGLNNQLKSVWAVIVSGLFFMLMHGNVEQTLHPFIMGCLLAFVVLRTNSLIPAMVIHFVNNLLILLLDNFAQAFYQFVFDNSLAFLLIGLALTAIVLFVFVKVTKNTVSPKEYEPTAREQLGNASQTSRRLNNYDKITTVVCVLLAVGLSISQWILTW